VDLAAKKGKERIKPQRTQRATKLGNIGASYQQSSKKQDKTQRHREHRALTLAILRTIKEQKKTGAKFSSGR
jgi:hypothetical protein